MKITKRIDVQNSETVRINDSLFENYPGPLDLSVTSVVSTGGNIIRNCGSGLDAYATGKITTTNNIILGPADEFLASPDIYDSDFDSVNITIDTSEDPFFGPTLLYVEEGNELIINPGVKLLFLGDYTFNVEGKIIATSKCNPPSPQFNVDNGCGQLCVQLAVALGV